MDIQGPKRYNKARERQMARRRKADEVRETRKTQKARTPRPTNWQGTAALVLQELGWYLRTQRWIWQGLGVVTLVVIVMFFLSYTISGRIKPNVTAMGVKVGGMSMDSAAQALNDAWQNDIQIRVVVNGGVIETRRPAELGLQLNAMSTAQAAREVGFRQGLFGFDVKPDVVLPDSGYLAVQDYLLNLTGEINIAPFNAGFAWQGDQLVTLPGKPGQLLDIAPTLAAIKDDPGTVVQLREFLVYVSPVYPDVSDSSAYLETVKEYTSQPFNIRGFDPYTDSFMTWSTDRDTLTSWIEVDGTGLSLREDVFAPFIDAQTQSLNSGPIEERYMNVEETLEAMRNAIARQQSDIMLRIRYRPVDYVVEAGDTASKISRKTGIPFYLIQQHNPGKNLDVLSIGETLSMPTRDVTMPNTPVPHKRIVVDLNKQEMWAFENEQLVFNWRISSGRSSAPTSPGIYQILGHSDVAYGSSYTMCDAIGCDQWEMYWFMGIYEVVPGLVNGFHGAVLLPNGGYLNNGDTGFPATFGCVMAKDDQAKALYEWADVGTVVEIISEEFEPMSTLAAQTQSL